MNEQVKTCPKCKIVFLAQYAWKKRACPNCHADLKTGKVIVERQPKIRRFYGNSEVFDPNEK